MDEAARGGGGLRPSLRLSRARGTLHSELRVGAALALCPQPRSTEPIPRRFSGETRSASDTARSLARLLLVQSPAHRLQLTTAMSFDDLQAQPADPAVLARSLLDKISSPASGDDELPPRRYLVALAGIPGSGKVRTRSHLQSAALHELTPSCTRPQSTFSAKLLDHLNSPSSSDPSSPPAVILPMDGFHRTQAELAADPDPELSFRRRGAPFTFAPDKLLDLVRRLRTDERLTAPAFSHADKDPVEGAIAIEPHHRIVVVEGNYLLLDEPVWTDVSREMDERWFYRVPEDVALRRIIKRHVQAGLAQDEQAAEAKALENDVLNGRHCVAHMLRPDRILEEIDHTVQ